MTITRITLLAPTYYVVRTNVTLLRMPTNKRCGYARMGARKLIYSAVGKR